MSERASESVSQRGTRTVTFHDGRPERCEGLR
jgi:hypothetical protein